MNFIYTLLSTLILFNGCLSANFDRLSFRNEVQQQNRNENILNEEFIFPIFDGSTLEQIIKFAKNPRVSSFIKEIIFPAKYDNYEYRFYMCNSPTSVYPTPSGFQIHKYEIVIDLIKMFGKSIQQIFYIHHVLEGNEEQTATVFQAIQEHCSDTLRLLSLEYFNENNLMEFKKPFENVEELKIGLPVNQTKFILPMNEMFPRLQRLYLIFFFASEYNEFLEIELPNLKNVDIIVTSDNLIAHEQLQKLFCKNPQIRNINYDAQMDDFIQVINDSLPNLEHLSISTLSSSIQPIQLDHVKYFSVTTQGVNGPFERLSMPRLESLSLPYYEVRGVRIIARDSWLKFFKNHKNLKEINCTAHTENELLEFLAELPNLTKIRIISYENFGIDFVSGLIENHKNLEILQYEVDISNHPEVSDLENYLEKYGNDWHVTHYIKKSVSTYTFQKKH